MSFFKNDGPDFSMFSAHQYEGEYQVLIK